MANATQRTILFLIADTGAGHRSAANAIRNALVLISQQEQEEWHERGQSESGDATPAPPTYRIEIVDVFEEYSRFPLREAVRLYGPTIRYNPRFYGRVFRMSNEARSVLAMQTMATPLIRSGLQRLFTSVRPDIIVSIHPLLNHLAIRALKDLGLDIPFITVVTDLVSVHLTWFAPDADAYLVPTEQARQVYLEQGLDPGRVHLLGMPIDPKFVRPLQSKQELQHKLGLEAGLPVVLLVGGGEGSGGLLDAVRIISRAHLPVQLLIITGRNKRLYAHLQRIRSHLHVPARIFGFVHNMPELMRAADVIVTKAGPGTISEAMACELPIILIGYVPGQEKGNVDYVLQSDLGVLAHDSIELVDAIRRLVKPGSAIMLRQLANARRLSRPQASFDIARFILESLHPANESTAWQTIQTRKRRRIMLHRLRPLHAPEVRVRALHRRLPRMTQITFLKSPVIRRLSRLRAQALSHRFIHETDRDSKQRPHL